MIAYHHYTNTNIFFHCSVKKHLAGLRTLVVWDNSFDRNLGDAVGVLAAVSLTLCEVVNPGFKDFYSKEVGGS